MAGAHNKGKLLYGEATFTIDDPRIEPVPESGCWLWVGYLCKKTGYGQANRPISYNGKEGNIGAHRATWIRANGPIPKGLVLDHICRVRSCVNPDHLRPVTMRQNVLFNSESIPAVAIARGVCGNCGGPYTQYKRQRACRACDNAVCKRLRASRIANGQCVYCGGINDTSKRGCRTCLDKHNAKALEKRNAKKH